MSSLSLANHPQIYSKLSASADNLIPYVGDKL
jgi:hypothetical protein